MNLKIIYTVLLLFGSISGYSQSKDSTYVDLNRSFRVHTINLVELKAKSNYITQKTTLPLFCKLEYKLDLVSPIQVRFRLGSLDYVNMLESK